MTDRLADLCSHWAFQTLAPLFAQQKEELLLVGGAVRDALCGFEIKDLDFATSAHPTKTQSILEKASIKSIPTGIVHGTITAVMNGQSFEITTFREDVQTDGRRAQVIFGQDVHQDAGRRDFTINALYLSHTGDLIDVVNGQDDLRAGRLRFIGRPNLRVQEDRLRVLRYFRFWAIFGTKHPDQPTAQALRAGFAAFSRLSPERIGQEILKIAQGPKFGDVAQLMHDMGGHPALFKTWNIPRLQRGMALAAQVDPLTTINPFLLLTLVTDDALKERLRLSNAQGKKIDMLRKFLVSEASPLELGVNQDFADAKEALIIQRAAQDRKISIEDINELQFATEQEFPITSHDLLPWFSGRALGGALRRAHKIWISSYCSLPKPLLLRKTLGSFGMHTEK